MRLMQTLQVRPAPTTRRAASATTFAGETQGLIPSRSPDLPAPMSAVRSLRIAHVTDFYLPRIGGIELHVSNLAAQQRRAGHHVDVISSNGIEPETTGNGPAAPDRVSFSPRSIRQATRAVLDGGYDVVHAHAGLATPLTFAVARAASRAGVPTTMTLHSMIGWLRTPYRLLDVVSDWRRWPVAWSAVSSVAAEPLRQLLGPDGVVDVLPNAIDLDAWQPLSPTPRPGRELVVVSVMRLAPRKRPMPLLALLRAARRAIPPDVSLRAVIVGEGRQRPAMQRYLARHDMGWVTLAGLQNQGTIRGLFRQADLFLAPARQESFGIAALEARAAGLPVLAMACSGIGEFLEPGVGGLLVEDDRSMSAAIAALAVAPADLAAMTAHNRAVRPLAGWDTALARTVGVYERAMRIQRRTAAAGAFRPALAGVAPLGVRTGSL